MKKWLLSLVAILFVGAALYATTADANSFRQVKQVSGSSLVMKKAMTTSSATVATLKRGDFVTVFSTSNGWASVEVKGQKGYVNAAYLANAKSTIKIASSKGGLVVKASPSKSAATSAVLKYKMIVEDFGSVGAGWNFVQYGNVTGYVASTFINVPKTTTMYVNVGAGSNLNVRNIASQSGKVVAKLAHNTKVTVHSTLSGWSYVSAGSTRGYVAARYLKASGTLTAQNASDYAPKCGTNYVFKYGPRDYADMMCTDSSDGTSYWEGYDLNDEFVTYYATKVKSNELIYSAEDSSIVYKFPMAAGKTWKQKDIYSTKTYYVVSVNEKLTLSDSYLGTSRTYRDVIKVRITYNTGYAFYVYLAKGIGEIYKTESKGKVLEQFVNSY